MWAGAQLSDALDQVLDGVDFLRGLWPKASSSSTRGAT